MTSDNPDAPTPGFEFPIASQDRIETALRALNADTNQPVRSVRPERNQQFAKPVVPMEANTQPAVGQAMTSTPLTKWQTSQATATDVMAKVQASGPNMIKVEEPTPTPHPTADYTSIDLPSRFAYYPFKDLYVKPFRTPHLAKLAKGDSLSSMQVVAETVGSVIVAPGYTNPVMMLSLSDLNAVMMWLRLNSFTKKTITVSTTCDNVAHHKMVEKGLKPKASLDVHARVDATTIEVTYLTERPDPDKFKIDFPQDGRVLHMRPETVTDAIQFMDHPLWLDQEFQYLARVASVLDIETMIPERSWTLQDKVDFVTQVLEPDQVLLAMEFCDLVDKSGIVESIETKCAECGASGTAKLSFDARCFLSPRF